MIAEAVVLAAGRGKRLGEVGESLPKGLLEIGGQTFVGRSIAMLKNCGVEKITIVVGHKKEAYEALFGGSEEVRLLTNPEFASRGNFQSLVIGLQAALAESVIVLDSDIVFEERALVSLISSSHESGVLVSGPTNAGDEVWATSHEGMLVSLSKTVRVSSGTVSREFVGISRIGARHRHLLLQLFGSDLSRWSTEDYEEALSQVSQVLPIGIVALPNLKWGEVDNLAQLERVRALFE